MHEGGVSDLIGEFQKELDMKRQAPLAHPSL